jgi:GNAT superfamily N-acetyltransferase
MKIKKVTNQRIRFDDWRESKKTFGYTILKLKSGNELIGNLLIEGNWIYTFSINPKYRRLGYGKMLLSKAEKIIAKDFKEVKLTPKDNDPDLRKYYTNLGYSGYTGNEPDYVAEDKTFWIMTKELGG